MIKERVVITTLITVMHSVTTLSHDQISDWYQSQTMRALAYLSEGRYFDTFIVGSLRFDSMSIFSYYLASTADTGFN